EPSGSSSRPCWEVPVMKKFPKPWYRRSRGVWYVTLDGQQHNLGPDQTQALELYKQLLHQPKAAAGRGQVVSAVGVVGVIDKFLDWYHEHRKPATYEWYRWRLQLFVDSIDRSLAVADLRHFHLDDWLSRHPEWSSGTKHGMARAVMRAMLWAAKKGHIDRS